MKLLSKLGLALGFVSLVLFFVINFSVGKPQEYCWGSDNCVVNCVPATAKLTAMCCEEHCNPPAQATVCIQTFTPAMNNSSSTCTCLESLQCIFAADSRFSNLAWFFLLIAIATGLFIFTEIRTSSASGSTSGAHFDDPESGATAGATTNH